MGSSRLCLDSLKGVTLLKCHNQGAHQDWKVTVSEKICLYALTAGRNNLFAEGRQIVQRVGRQVHQSRGGYDVAGLAPVLFPGQSLRC